MSKGKPRCSKAVSQTKCSSMVNEPVTRLSQYTQNSLSPPSQLSWVTWLNLKMAALLQYANIILGPACLVVLIFLLRRAYSVYLGPLAKFPGPKLAAATLWYEFYYDVILKGRYTFKIKELHEQYGILQTTPFSCYRADFPVRPHCSNQSQRTPRRRT